MFKNIKRLREISKNKKLQSLSNLKLDEQNRVMLELKIDDFNEAFSPFATADHRILNSELRDFLDKTTEDIDLQYDISLNIKTSSKITQTQRKEFETALSNTYAYNIVEDNAENKHDVASSLIMLLLGMVFLGLSVLFSTIFPSYIILETITVVGWLFVWEAADVLLIGRASRRKQRINNYRKMQAKVSFSHLDEAAKPKNSDKSHD